MEYFHSYFAFLYNLQHVTFDLQTISHMTFGTTNLFFCGIFPLIFWDSTQSRTCHFWLTNNVHMTFGTTNLFFCGIFPLIFCVLYILQHVNYDLQTFSCSIFYTANLLPYMWYFNSYLVFYTFCNMSLMTVQTLVRHDILHNKSSNILCDNSTYILSFIQSTTSH